MRKIRLHGLMLAVAGVLAACASGGGSEAAPPEPTAEPTAVRSGTYYFQEWVRLTSPQVVIRGEVTFLPDTVTARLHDAPCWYQSAQQTSTRIVYDCGGTTLEIDRQNPDQPVRYRLMTTVQVPERVCGRYVTTDGVQVCVQWQIEYHDRPERRSGTLSLLQHPT